MIRQKAGVLIFSSSLILTLFYYNYHDNISRVDIKTEREFRIREPIYTYNGSEDFLINTTGCVIPNYQKTLKFIGIENKKKSCGQRAIFVQRIDNDQIVFQIDAEKMEKQLKKNKKYECCYKFASRSNTAGKEDTHLSYTPCKTFKSGSKTALLQEVVTVTCVSPSNKSHNIYEDAYLVLKKRPANKNKSKNEIRKWNVLLLGMDTMSRARIFSTMPKTVKYLQKHGWLDYKGYQKVGYNTFPNLMSILTGMNISSIYNACKPNMYTCNEHMIWSTFRRAGYVTAYGEDYLRLPDTFCNHNGFKTIPTHHYMRPLFLTGERKEGNLICTSRLPSGKHILDYAYDYADTYKDEGFFGMFWINSYSHNLDNSPSLFENDILNFFEKANDTGFLNSTIIVFLSDHGIRFGLNRVPMESYYEERLPMFFVWVPNEFRKLHEEEYYNLQLNQNKLLTPYDLYVTLVKISNMSVSSVDIASEACPSCKNLFEEISPRRTCAEAAVSQKWCSCHDMKYVDRTVDKHATKSIQLAVAYVQDKASKVQTIHCTKCHSFQLDRVLRTHSFHNGTKTYYVIAFQVKPGKIVYEATVLKENTELSILNGVDTLSVYNTRGNCVEKAVDRIFCVCQKVKCSKQAK